MATRRELLILISLVVLILLLVKLVEFFKVNVVEADASKFVTEDLYANYPDADIDIMTVKEKYNDEGEKYFEVKAKVTEDYNTPCPVRMHIYYNYPVQNFVPQPTEYITLNCEVCTEGTCTIAFPEEAIIASHTFEGTENVDGFIEGFESSHPTVSESEENWEVMWDSPVSTHYYVVVVGKDGNIESVEKVEKS
jgi:hypothetical protein